MVGGWGLGSKFRRVVDIGREMATEGDSGILLLRVCRASPHEQETPEAMWWMVGECEAVYYLMVKLTCMVTDLLIIVHSSYRAHTARYCRRQATNSIRTIHLNKDSYLNGGYQFHLFLFN